MIITKKHNPDSYKGYQTMILDKMVGSIKIGLSEVDKIAMLVRPDTKLTDNDRAAVHSLRLLRKGAGIPVEEVANVVSYLVELGRYNPEGYGIAIRIAKQANVLEQAQALVNKHIDTLVAIGEHASAGNVAYKAGMAERAVECYLKQATSHTFPALKTIKLGLVPQHILAVSEIIEEFGITPRIQRLCDIAIEDAAEKYGYDGAGNCAYNLGMTDKAKTLFRRHIGMFVERLEYDRAIDFAKQAQMPEMIGPLYKLCADDYQSANVVKKGKILLKGVIAKIEKWRAKRDRKVMDMPAQ